MPRPYYNVFFLQAESQLQSPDKDSIDTASSLQQLQRTSACKAVPVPGFQEPLAGAAKAGLQPIKTEEVLITEPYCQATLDVALLVAQCSSFSTAGVQLHIATTSHWAVDVVELKALQSLLDGAEHAVVIACLPSLSEVGEHSHQTPPVAAGTSAGEAQPPNLGAGPPHSRHAGGVKKKPRRRSERKIGQDPAPLDSKRKQLSLRRSITSSQLPLKPSGEAAASQTIHRTHSSAASDVMHSVRRGSVVLQELSLLAASFPHRQQQPTAADPSLATDRGQLNLQHLTDLLTQQAGVSVEPLPCAPPKAGQRHRSEGHRASSVDAGTSTTRSSGLMTSMSNPPAGSQVPQGQGRQAPGALQQFSTASRWSQHQAQVLADDGAPKAFMMARAEALWQVHKQPAQASVRSATQLRREASLPQSGPQMQEGSCNESTGPASHGTAKPRVRFAENLSSSPHPGLELMDAGGTQVLCDRGEDTVTGSSGVFSSPHLQQLAPTLNPVLGLLPRSTNSPSKARARARRKSLLWAPPGQWAHSSGPLDVASLRSQPQAEPQCMSGTAPVLSLLEPGRQEAGSQHMVGQHLHRESLGRVRPAPATAPSSQECSGDQNLGHATKGPGITFSPIPQPTAPPMSRQPGGQLTAAANSVQGSDEVQHVSPATSMFRRWATAIDTSLRSVTASDSVCLTSQPSHGSLSTRDAGNALHLTAVDITLEHGAEAPPPCPESDPVSLVHQRRLSALEGHLDSRLKPVYANTAAMSLLRVPSLEACKHRLNLQLCQNPTLMMMLEELLRSVLEQKTGRPASFSHFLPAYSHLGVMSHTAAAEKLGTVSADWAGGFVQVQIQVINLAMSPQCQEPALFIYYRSAGWAGAGPMSATALLPSSHALPSGDAAAAADCTATAQELTVLSTLNPCKDMSQHTATVASGVPQTPSPLGIEPGSSASPAAPQRLEGDIAAQLAQLQLMYLALSHSPSLVTIMSYPDGRVLFQNGRSVDYCGLVYTLAQQVSRPLSHPHHTLRRIFVHDSSALEDMLATVAADKTWTGLVRMPVCLDLSDDPSAAPDSLTAVAQCSKQQARSVVATCDAPDQLSAAGTEETGGGVVLYPESSLQPQNACWVSEALGETQALASSLYPTAPTAVPAVDPHLSCMPVPADVSLRGSVIKEGLLELGGFDTLQGVEGYDSAGGPAFQFDLSTTTPQDALEGVLEADKLQEGGIQLLAQLRTHEQSHEWQDPAVQPYPPASGISMSRPARTASRLSPALKPSAEQLRHMSSNLSSSLPMSSGRLTRLTGMCFQASQGLAFQPIQTTGLSSGSPGRRSYQRLASAGEDSKPTQGSNRLSAGQLVLPKSPSGPSSHISRMNTQFEVDEGQRTSAQDAEVTCGLGTKGTCFDSSLPIIWSAPNAFLPPARLPAKAKSNTVMYAVMSEGGWLPDDQDFLDSADGPQDLATMPSKSLNTPQPHGASVPQARPAEWLDKADKPQLDRQQLPFLHTQAGRGHAASSLQTVPPDPSMLRGISLDGLEHTLQQGASPQHATQHALSNHSHLIPEEIWQGNSTLTTHDRTSQPQFLIRDSVVHQHSTRRHQAGQSTPGAANLQAFSSSRQPGAAPTKVSSGGGAVPRGGWLQGAKRNRLLALMHRPAHRSVAFKVSGSDTLCMHNLAWSCVLANECVLHCCMDADAEAVLAGSVRALRLASDAREAQSAHSVPIPLARKTSQADQWGPERFGTLVSEPQQASPLPGRTLTKCGTMTSRPQPSSLGLPMHQSFHQPGRAPTQLQDATTTPQLLDGQGARAGSLAWDPLPAIKKHMIHGSDSANHGVGAGGLPGCSEAPASHVGLADKSTWAGTEALAAAAAAATHSQPAASASVGSAAMAGLDVCQPQMQGSSAGTPGSQQPDGASLPRQPLLMHAAKASEGHSQAPSPAPQHVPAGQSPATSPAISASSDRTWLLSLPSAPTTVPSLPGVKEEEEEVAGSREEVLQESAGPSLAVPPMPKPASELEFDWHDIEARLAISPVTGQQVLVLTQQDITQYVTAELEVKQGHRRRANCQGHRCQASNSGSSSGSSSSSRPAAAAGRQQQRPGSSSSRAAATAGRQQQQQEAAATAGQQQQQQQQQGDSSSGRAATAAGQQQQQQGNSSSSRAATDSSRAAAAAGQQTAALRCCRAFQLLGRLVWVLDAEHKLLEEIFPRHVLQAMAMRNAASFNSPISLHGVRTTTALPPTPEEQGPPPHPTHVMTATSSQLPKLSHLPSARVSSWPHSQPQGAPYITSTASEHDISGDIDTAPAKPAQPGNGPNLAAASPLISGPQPSLPLQPVPAMRHLAHVSASLPIQSQEVSALPGSLMPSSSSDRLAGGSPQRSNPGTMQLGTPRLLQQPASGSSSWKAAGAAQGSGRVGPPGAKPVQTSPDLARHHEAITVLFADITSFTSMCSQLPPTEIMSFLNGLFTEFDELVEQHGIYKVETIGDCFMCAGGLVSRDADGFNSVTSEVDPDHAKKVGRMHYAMPMMTHVQVLLFAVDMLRVAANTPLPIGDGHEPVRLRVVRYPLWPGHQWGGGAQDATLLPLWVRQLQAADCCRRGRHIGSIGSIGALGYCEYGLPHGIDWTAWLHSAGWVLGGLSRTRLYPRPGYSLPLAGSFPCSGHQHSSSGRHLLSSMRCMFNAALQSLSSHLPGCGASLALAALPLPLLGSAAGSALMRLLRLAGRGVLGPGSEAASCEASWLLRGACRGLRGATTGHYIRPLTGRSRCWLQAGRTRRRCTCPAGGFQSAGLVALRLFSCLSLGCWSGPTRSLWRNVP
ncbi:hypothetical protein QJQ45_014541 [Haematococcus lacustris]|nr:hypothetical protein QJQ45_014541 [Haematococcus lacustris]